MRAHHLDLVGFDYLCGYCDDEYATKEELHVHLDAEHPIACSAEMPAPNTRPSTVIETCTWCLTQFDNRDMLIEHVLVRHIQEEIG